MTPWTQIDTGPVPGCEAPLRLMRRGHEFSIFAGQNELMNSVRGGSEEALAVLACERLSGRPAPRVLIGGLGMGFTLRAALASLGPDAHVAVAELVPAVIGWARGPLAEVFAGCLDDPRVALHEADVNRLIQSGEKAWDAILLDVDNGPEGLTRRENDRLYDSWGVKRALWALRPGGVLGVWSGGPDRKFKARLQNGGFAVDEVRPRSGGRRGARHVVWLATRPDGAGRGPAGRSPPPRRDRAAAAQPSARGTRPSIG